MCIFRYWRYISSSKQHESDLKDKLAIQNVWDTELYKYVKKLYKRQYAKIKNSPDYKDYHKDS